MSIDRWMDKEEMVHIYSETWLSHKKEQNNAICSNMDGPRNYHTKWTKSESDKQIPYDTLMCSVQFSSVAQSCPTLCDSMDCSTPGFRIHCQLLEFTQTHVHWVSDAIQPSHPLLSPSPPAFNLSRHQGLFKCVSVTCKPMDCSPPGSSVHGIFKARKLEWVAMPSSRGSFRPREFFRPRDQPPMSWIFGIAGRFFTTELPGKSDSTHMWNLKYDTKELIYKTETGSQA